MDDRTETERLAINNNLTSMPANPWEFDVELGPSPDESLSRILAVIGEIAKHSSNRWPSDDEWRSLLPAWLKRHLSELKKEQIDHLLATTPRDQWDILPWEFGSWIDAIRDRGWKWWGYKQKLGAATLVLHIAMFPERIDAFKEILRAAGIKILRERYKP
ncbi:MAG: hypothetical protein ACRCV9_08410 [Burkholderiaceae bacterium]